MVFPTNNPVCVWTDNWNSFKQAGAKNMTLKKALNVADGMNITEAPMSANPFSLSPDIEIPFEGDWSFEAVIRK